MSDVLEIVGKCVTIFAAAVGALSAGFAAISYRGSVRLKRAEWLQKLYQQFYEVDRYKKIREILDSERELSDFHVLMDSHPNDDLVWQLWDYLNFFEFVASLKKLKQIEDDDLKLLFEYPIQRIKENARIMGRLEGQGYEQLGLLLRDTIKSRASDA